MINNLNITSTPPIKNYFFGILLSPAVALMPCIKAEYMKNLIIRFSVASGKRENSDHILNLN